MESVSHVRCGAIDIEKYALSSSSPISTGIDWTVEVEARATPVERQRKHEHPAFTLSENLDAMEIKPSVDMLDNRHRLRRRTGVRRGTRECLHGIGKIR
jgi:hypothetical protein